MSQRTLYGKLWGALPLRGGDTDQSLPFHVPYKSKYQYSIVMEYADNGDVF